MVRLNEGIRDVQQLFNVPAIWSLAQHSVAFSASVSLLLNGTNDEIF